MVLHSRTTLLPLNRSPGSEGLGLSAQIYKTLRTGIIEGRLAPAMRLPSARQLAADWKVSRNTVDDAIQRMQSEGFVVRRVGSGTFVAADFPGSNAKRPQALPRPPSEAGRKALLAVSTSGRTASRAYAPGSTPRPEAFVAGLPALDLFPLDLWRRLVAKRMRTSGESLLGYFPAMGHAPLREATARHLAATRGIDCAPEQVMILNSSMQAVELAARVLLEPGDGAWVEDPCYPNLRAALAMAGARIVAVPVDDNGIDVRAGMRMAPSAALAHVSPSCQYPTGVTLSIERRMALLRWAEEAGSWIVEDDYQSEFTYQGRPLTPLYSLDRGERVLYLGTFTNAVFPSLRLAYVVLPHSLVPVFQAVRGQLDDHTHGLAQAVMADFADGGHFNAHLRRMRAVYLSRRDALVAACARELGSAARLGPAVAGMNAALHLAPRLADAAVAATAQASGLHAFPLSRYAESGRGVNGLLLGYTALSERRIAAGIARLAQVIAAA